MPLPNRSVVRWVGLLVAVAALVGVFALRNRLPGIGGESTTSEHEESPVLPMQEAKVLQLSPQARQNMRLVSKRVTPQSYWRTVLIPGEIVDRPGLSDRGVTSPAVGVVTQIHAFPGDTVHAGDRLFTLRLLSEYIQNTQSELFKATRETQLIAEQVDRLKKLVDTGSVPQSRLIELDQQSRRQHAAIQSYRQDLLTRGLSLEQIKEATEGRFVASIEVVAPPDVKSTAKEATSAQPEDPPPGKKAPQEYEVQELRVELGNQVQAGQLLGVLANHHSLYIQGHAFKSEAPYLERAAQYGWPVDVEFAEDDPGHWTPLKQSFQIHHLSNSIDATSRTFDFYIPLANQSHTYEKSGRDFLVWRFRPGQRVRLHVPVEEMKDVIVLPAGAVVREGPEAYVFRQNGDLFHRSPVRVLHEDRLHVVLANDGSVAPGLFVAQSGAASLNRVLKAQSSSGVPAGMHVHADGTVHGAH